MKVLRCICNVLLVLGFASVASAQTATIRNGDDSFISGSAVVESVDTSGDTFIAARTISASGTTGGDLHVAGFDVVVKADATEDLYVAGASVVVRGNVADDLTAAGFSVRVEPTSQIGGNARLFGNAVTIESPVSGALTATGMDIILNAKIAGDVRLVAGSITFGPDAEIEGALVYGSEREITVPERVIPAERVRFERITMVDAWDEFDEIRREMPVLPTFMTMLSGFVISLLFFLVLGALTLGFMPERLEALRSGIAQSPGRSVLLGVIGLSMLFGAVPITVMTIIGLPFVPIAVLAIVVAWIFGYALGAYSVAMRIWTGFDGDANPSNVARLAIFAAAITFVALLNFIPFVGWVVNFTLVLMGIGALTSAVIKFFIDNPGPALDIKATDA